MFDWLKKKKNEEVKKENDMPNGIPGTAVPLINNPMVKNLDRIDIQIGRSAPGYLDSRYRTVNGETEDYSKLAESVATLLRVRRVGTLAVAGEGILDCADKVNPVLEMAAVYNIENRYVITDGKTGDRDSAAAVIGYACNGVVIPDECEPSALLEELTEEIPVIKVSEQKDAKSGTPAGGCAAEVFGNALNDVRSLMIDPDGTARVCGFPIGNCLERDLIDILEEYDPYSNPIMAMILQGGPDAAAALCTPEEAGLPRCQRCRAMAARLFAE